MEEEILFKIQIPTDSAVTSIENLTKANKALREERKKLDLQSAEGQKRAQEINTQLDKNTDIIKQNSSALEKQRLNVGNYTGALDKLVPGLGATANGFVAMTKTALAFIATPIGAVIGALGLAIAALTAYFKGSEEGQTKFNKIMNVGAAIVGKFSDLVQFLGKFVFENLSKGFEKIIGFLNKFVPGFEEATNALAKYLNLDVADHISQLEEEQVQLNRLLIVERGRLRAAIEDAKLRAESTKDAKERTKALQEVTDLTNELFDKESRLAKLELDIAKENAKLANNTIEDNDAIAESIAKVDDIERQRSAALKENATKQLALREQDKAQRQKDFEEQQKQDELQSEIDRQKRIDEVDQEYAKNEQLSAAEQALQDNLTAIRNKSADNQLKNTKTILDAKIDAIKEEQKRQKQADQQDKQTQLNKVAVIQATVNQGTAILKQGTIAANLAALAQAVVNTYAAANLALKTYPPPWGAIAAATNIGIGLVNVAKIKSNLGFADGGLVEGFAGGGLSGTRIMGHHGRSIRRSNGDNLLATVKTGEVILNERQQARLGGAATFRAIGVPGFASGGSTALSVATAARNSESIGFQREIFNAISQIRPVVTVEDINTGQTRVDVIDSFRQVQ